MKVLIRVLKWSVIGVFTLFVSLILGFVIHLETSFDRVVPPERQQAFFHVLDSAASLPNSFTDVIAEHYPGYLTQGVWRAWWRQALDMKQQPCPCQQINLWGMVLPGFAIQVVRATLELGEHYSPRRCYEIMMGRMDYMRGNKGVTEAAKAYYNKDLSQLNEREILSLDLMRKGGIRFDHLHNKENLDAAVDEVLNER